VLLRFPAKGIVTGRCNPAIVVVARRGRLGERKRVEAAPQLVSVYPVDEMTRTRKLPLKWVTSPLVHFAHTLLTPNRSGGCLAEKTGLALPRINQLRLVRPTPGQAETVLPH
jgi:hypothetical protein